jgi:hypothetical protein
LFLDRTWNTNFHRPLQSLLKRFYRRQSFQQIKQTMQRVDVFDLVLINEEQKEHTFFLFQIFD